MHNLNARNYTMHDHNAKTTHWSYTHEFKNTELRHLAAVQAWEAVGSSQNRANHRVKKKSRGTFPLLRHEVQCNTAKHRGKNTAPKRAEAPFRCLSMRCNGTQPEGQTKRHTDPNTELTRGRHREDAPFRCSGMRCSATPPNTEGKIQSQKEQGHLAVDQA
eukprot:1141134-Pelagomonas_calceolata.AAC.7